ncbi:hypothetical protein [Candidatus Symbiopectobacterium sp. NZEC135]|uniref:hypothetical protein n=1 Tax=Candidatus Symbiopectobacterium sp. NZEC135 TaxID=2820471 RepID=UPI002225BECA|nr:hypothetical protein [Candidatus Symbiopectobacterium sp. NZEC135]MCW2478130.1 hypothetical protein [Candidatus Symbiopectobacterium sp. NZEC135]
MEVGTWADWVSALSTFGTLGIAFAAYRKAPEWIQQRKQQDGYELAKNLICEQLPLLRKSITNIGSKLGYYKEMIPDFEDSLLYDIELEDIECNLSELRKTGPQTNDIYDNIQRLKRLGWNINDEIESLFFQTIELYDTTHKNAYNFWLISRHFLTVPRKELQDGIKKRLIEKINIINTSEENFYSLYHKLNEYNQDFLLYFGKYNKVTK